MRRLRVCVHTPKECVCERKDVHACCRKMLAAQQKKTNVHFAELGKALHAVPGKPNHCRELKSLTLFFHHTDPDAVCSK